MQVTALLNQKGGVGKTTLALHLAAALCAQGQRVLYVDADPQGTALDWSSARTTPAPFPIVALPSDTLHRELPRIGEGFDHAIIDGAPRLEKLTRSAVAAADVVLIPAQPSGPDIWAAAALVEIIGEAQIMKPQLQAAFVVMRLRNGTALGKAALGILADQPLPTLAAHVHDRIAYAEAITSARTVFESHPRGVAALEIEAVTNALLALHQQSEARHGESRPVLAA